MVPGLFLTSVATVVMSAALFTRRSRSGWLDELDDIRDGALASPEGEVATAMADVEPLPETDASPLAVLEVSLPPAAPAGIDAAVRTVESVDPVELTEPIELVEPVEATEPVELADAAEPIEPVVDVEDQLPEPVLVQPSPHPIRPQEMWHPQVAVAPLAPRTEERLDPSDLLADGGDGPKAARFRFARLRAVTPEGGALVGVDDDLPSSHRPPAPRPEADLFGREHPTTTSESHLGNGTAPLVPERPRGGGGALITGPVSRRRNRGAGDPSRGRHDHASTDAPRDDLEDQADPVAADLAAEPAWRWVPDEPVASPEAVDEPIDEAVESPEPEAPNDAAPRVLDVAVDGTVGADAGVLRLTEGSDAVVRQDDAGIHLDLTGGWCWTDRPEGSATVTITLAAGTLTLPAGTAALAVAEADGTAFVVVVGGEAQLAHAGGRLRLRAGALVLAPPGAAPQVDVAVGSEILSDPLVQHNLRLDAAR